MVIKNIKKDTEFILSQEKIKRIEELTDKEKQVSIDFKNSIKKIAKDNKKDKSLS